ncbi:Autophagy-related protein 20 [Labeo rohita]|uniref:Autophagy-related protein 20 n=1 Tax=Labeo rohita TaxID=84645 RepID=A0ABQ8LA76_LABRO|nr:Autophagy-related protein 20 [Labeo rohita]
MIIGCFNPKPRHPQHWWVSSGGQITAHQLPPGFQLNSSLLLHNQQEALSAASPILRTVIFLSLPITPMAVSILHTDWAGNPLQPTSTGKSHACQPFPLQSCKRSWYLAFFLSNACSQPSSHGTVSSMRMIFFASSDHSTASGLRVVWTTGGELQSFPQVYLHFP